jgi:glycosyltransferase involved in cell wall biosynthesis
LRFDAQRLLFAMPRFVHPTHSRARRIGGFAKAPRCLAIVPVYNERDSIGTLIRHLRRALPHFDVVVIDDGSTDDTVKNVPPGTPVVPLPFNLGIGAAMQTGYRYAALYNYDVAVQVDGDGQHRPSEVLKMVDHLVRNDVDLVIGSRFLNNVRYRQTPVRAFGSLVLRRFLRLLTGLDITDCTSGFRACNKKVIHAYAHWYPEDYPEPEVILLLNRVGFKIEEVSVKMRQRRKGQSSIGLFSGAFYMAKVTICLLLDTARKPWPAGKVYTHATETDSGAHWSEHAAAGDTPAQSIQA